MRSSKPVFFLFAITLAAVANAADGIDMDDPRRLIGRENDIRIDAQLVRDTVTPGTPIGVTYQIQNFTDAPIAIADRVASASYDADTLTIVVSIGSETPQEHMPRMITVGPGEKKLLRTSATPSLLPTPTRAAFVSAPRYVQVKVTILRDVAPFRALIANQTHGAQRFPDELFDAWFECNDTILLNSVPIQFAPRQKSIDAENRDMRGSF